MEISITNTTGSEPRRVTQVDARYDLNRINHGVRNAKTMTAQSTTRNWLTRVSASNRPKNGQCSSSKAALFVQLTETRPRLPHGPCFRHSLQSHTCRSKVESCRRAHCACVHGRRVDQQAVQSRSPRSSIIFSSGADKRAQSEDLAEVVTCCVRLAPVARISR
jgi:hypothetical protein